MFKKQLDSAGGKQSTRFVTVNGDVQYIERQAAQLRIQGHAEAASINNNDVKSKLPANISPSPSASPHSFPALPTKDRCYEVRVGQIWAECDPYQHNRYIIVTEVGETRVKFMNIRTGGKTDIRRDRLKPGSRGYCLVYDPVRTAVIRNQIAEAVRQRRYALDRLPNYRELSVGPLPPTPNKEAAPKVVPAPAPNDIHGESLEYGGKQHPETRIALQKSCVDA